MPIFDPKTKEEDKRRLEYDIFWKSRQRRGISFLIKSGCENETILLQ
jgi:malate dehydrogenase (oxaloacetate-decarboxylating)(NADP+)